MNTTQFNLMMNEWKWNSCFNALTQQVINKIRKIIFREAEEVEVSFQYNISDQTESNMNV